MRKFHAYIGLVATIILAFSCMYPFGATYRVDATLFDNDAVSAIIQSTSDIPKFMARAHDCLRYSRGSEALPADGACAVGYVAPDLLYIYNHSDELSRYIPDVAERLSAYLDAYNPESSLGESLQKDVVAHYPEMFSQYKARYAIVTYVAHALLVVVLILLVWKRNMVGRAISATVAAPIRLTVKGLRAFHRKI